jgi:hypothetical protein
MNRIDFKVIENSEESNLFSKFNEIEELTHKNKLIEVYYTISQEVSQQHNNDGNILKTIDKYLRLFFDAIIFTRITVDDSGKYPITTLAEHTIISGILDKVLSTSGNSCVELDLDQLIPPMSDDDYQRTCFKNSVLSINSIYLLHNNKYILCFHKTDELHQIQEISAYIVSTVLGNYIRTR